MRVPRTTAAAPSISGARATWTARARAQRAVVQPREGLSLYGNRVEVLRQGPIAPQGTLNAGEALEPIVARQIEAGARYDFGRWTAGVALFEVTQPDGITDFATNLFGVDGEQRNRGVELTALGEPREGPRVLG